jgi:ubiquinone/menaquinone biosynthesis C-methylase UbiE
MSSIAPDEVALQRNYYAKTASKYEEMHGGEGVHEFALSLMVGVLDYLNIESILDVGSGLGNSILYVNRVSPHVRMIGVEPVKELREVGYARGIAEDTLIEGDALNLSFQDGEFDLVCAFGILHHIKEPHIAIGEMLRVARKAVFLSDNNNFGYGSFFIRSLKQLINFCGLWPVYNLLKTKGKGYSFSQGDGLFYSYSLFNNYRQIEKQCRAIHLFNTKGGRINPYKTASHVALLGIKR